MIRLGISLGMGALMALGQINSASGQPVPYEPPDWDDPNCMIDDPWVWEDFGGPIPCAGPSGGPQGPDVTHTSVEVGRTALVTWDQMVASDPPRSPLSGIPAHDRPEEGQPSASDDGGAIPEEASSSSLGCDETGPAVGLSFQGAFRPDTLVDRPPDGAFPPDTMGAAGPRHFLEVINGNVSVYDKVTGYRLRSLGLNQFFFAVGNDLYDPRVLFDKHSQRWIVSAANGRFTTPHGFALAVSRSDDPTKGWFQLLVEPGEIADYPTLGVDVRGIYVAAFYVNALWVFEKLPLIANPPGVGRVYKWVSQGCDPSSPLRAVEDALQPAHTYDNLDAEFLIQTKGANQLEVYKITGVAGPTCPILELAGTVTTASFSDPPDAPALGSTTNINTLDERLMMAVYRDGYLWTCHGTGGGAGAACRWYQIDPQSLTVVQSGTVADSSTYFYYPSLMVNDVGDVAMGFSGSNAGQYVAAYFTARRACDPLNTMRPPQLLKPGEASYTVPPSGGVTVGVTTATPLWIQKMN